MFEPGLICIAELPIWYTVLLYIASHLMTFDFLWKSCMYIGNLSITLMFCCHNIWSLKVHFVHFCQLFLFYIHIFYALFNFSWILIYTLAKGPQRHAPTYTYTYLCILSFWCKFLNKVYMKMKNAHKAIARDLYLCWILKKISLKKLRSFLSICFFLFFSAIFCIGQKVVWMKSNFKCSHVNDIFWLAARKNMQKEIYWFRAGQTPIECHGIDNILRALRKKA